jgi:hypothetical protein
VSPSVGSATDDVGPQHLHVVGVLGCGEHRTGGSVVAVYGVLVLMETVGAALFPWWQGYGPMNAPERTRIATPYMVAAGAVDSARWKRPKSGARAVSSARAQESGPPSWSTRRAAAESLVLRHLIAGDVVLRHHVRPVHVRVDGLSVGESGRIETGRTARLLLA